MALDAGNKKFVGICLGVLDEVRWCLLRWNCNQWDTLIRGFEPHDLGALDQTTGLITTIAFAFTSLSFLLLLRGSRRWSE